MSVHISRHVIVEAAVRAAVVVDPDGLVDGAACLQTSTEVTAEAVFLFEDAVQSFRVSVFVAVVFLCHADGEVTQVQDFDVVV